MGNLSRRKFLQGCARLGSAWAVSHLPGRTTCHASGASDPVRFKLELSCHSLGVRATPGEAIELAGRFGFQAVAPPIPSLLALDDTAQAALRQELEASGLVWGAGSLPFDFRQDDPRYQAGLQELRWQAPTLARLGIVRLRTHVAPGHPELTYLRNFRRHVSRLRSIADVLAPSGLRLGLEYVGPATARAGVRHPFIHTLEETGELLQEIGRENLGYVLDSWHWYTAGEPIEALHSVRADEVVACDLNDAPAGLPVDQQVDTRRELPATTGVIDVKAFLGALLAMGYPGPVRAEPFNNAIAALPRDRAIEATRESLRRALALLE